MTTQTIEAIYENGILRPLQPVHGLDENERLVITIKSVSKDKHPLEAVIGTLPDEDALEISQIVNGEFEKVNVDEW